MKIVIGNFISFNSQQGLESENPDTVNVDHDSLNFHFHFCNICSSLKINNAFDLNNLLFR